MASLWGYGLKNKMENADEEVKWLAVVMKDKRMKNEKKNKKKKRKNRKRSKEKKNKLKNMKIKKSKVKINSKHENEIWKEK